MKVILLGAGMLGKQLYKTFVNHPTVDLIQWYNRSETDTISPEGIALTNVLDDLEKADLLLLAVSDDALSGIAKKIHTNALVLHTAGSVSIDALHPHKRRGVWYPIQSFSNQKNIDFSVLTFGVETNNPSDKQLVLNLTKSIEAKAIDLNSDQREKLHFAAVMVNNFTNHLFTQAALFCEENNLSFNLLRPLIQETVDKIDILSPQDAQTGPALRNDQSTLKRHLELIKNPTLKAVYTTLTAAIQKHHGSEKL
jgi:predicted short-subunit dehydrogenase-like oxidoreductase (DUF2520 family)|tara:strand:+ start:2603 stop:3361 length:759 start_codon:yes stop_codon:yes gene_type:complete